MWHYVAFLDQAPAELLQSLIDQGWETTVTPARVSTLKRTGSDVSEAAAREELRTLVAESEGDAKILADTHAYLTPSTSIGGTAAGFREHWPGIVVIADPHSADAPGKKPAADDGKTP